MQVCPTCRENLLEVPEVRGYGRGAQGRSEIRRGLLYMLFAAVFYHFAAKDSPLPLPFDAEPWLSEYVLPFLFLLGMGLIVLGVYRRVTA